MGISSISGTPLKTQLPLSIANGVGGGHLKWKDRDTRFDIVRLKPRAFTQPANTQNTLTPSQVTFSSNLINSIDPSVKEVQDLKKMLISYHDLPTSAAHSWKKIKMFNRWGNDTKEEYLENIKNQIKAGARAIIFYDTTTNSKRHLKTLEEHENITLVSYEALRAHFSKINRSLAKLIVDSIDHHKKLVQCNRTGRVVNEQLLLDPIILCYLCHEMDMLGNNSFLLEHRHMTKTYDEKWVDAAVKQTQEKTPVQAGPNVCLVTPISQEAFKALFTSFKVAPVSGEMMTRFKKDSKTNMAEKSERVEIDKWHLNRADNKLGYGKLSFFEDSATCYVTQHTTLYMNKDFRKQIEGEKNEFRYVDEKSKVLVKWRDGTSWSLLTNASWKKENAFDSLDKILDAMITVLQLKGKLETAKMLPIAREVTENPSLTEEALMQALKNEITKRDLTSKDFHTEKLIVKSTSEEVLKTLATIPLLNRKLLNPEYAVNSLTPEIKKYSDYPLCESFSKGLMSPKEDSINSEQFAIPKVIDMPLTPSDYPSFAYKKPYKNAITEEARNKMVKDQHKYNERLETSS